MTSFRRTDQSVVPETDDSWLPRPTNATTWFKCTLVTKQSSFETLNKFSWIYNGMTRIANVTVATCFDACVGKPREPLNLLLAYDTYQQALIRRSTWNDSKENNLSDALMYFTINHAKVSTMWSNCALVQSQSSLETVNLLPIASIMQRPRATIRSPLATSIMSVDNTGMKLLVESCHGDKAFSYCLHLSDNEVRIRFRVVA